MPQTWTDIATFPGNVDGASVPTINAATDLQAWKDTFDAPGVHYAAFPYTSDPQTLINLYGLHRRVRQQHGRSLRRRRVHWLVGAVDALRARRCRGVASHRRQPRRPGVHGPRRDPAHRAAGPAGLRRRARHVQRDADGDVARLAPTTTPGTAPSPDHRYLSDHRTGADDRTCADAGRTGAGRRPPGRRPHRRPTPRATTTTPAAVVDRPAPSTTASPTAGTQLVDETNFLTVTVPADWVDQNISNSRHDDGSARATITAARRPAVSSTTPGTAPAHMVAVPSSTDPAAMLARFAYPNSCTNGGVMPFDDGRFVGQRQTGPIAMGTTTRVVNIAARPARQLLHDLRPGATGRRPTTPPSTRSSSTFGTSCPAPCTRSRRCVRAVDADRPGAGRAVHGSGDAAHEPHRQTRARCRPSASRARGRTRTSASR